MTISFNGIILIWCSVMSFICFMAMGIDKLKARAGKWRIPERPLFLLAALAFIRHRSNIVRLVNGTERKIGEKKI